MHRHWFGDVPLKMPDMSMGVLIYLLHIKSPDPLSRKMVSFVQVHAAGVLCDREMCATQEGLNSKFSFRSSLCAETLASRLRWLGFIDTLEILYNFYTEYIEILKFMAASGQLWASIIEKGFAKACGSYEAPSASHRPSHACSRQQRGSVLTPL